MDAPLALFALFWIGVFVCMFGSFRLSDAKASYTTDEQRPGLRKTGRILIVIGAMHMLPGLAKLWVTAIAG